MAADETDAAETSVLVVEYDFDLRDALVPILEYEGHRVVSAANGREALDRLKAMPLPSLILLDLMMPVMNGWQFRAEQQHDPQFAHIPVVIVTALAVNNRQALGAEAVLTKPLDFDRLLKVVRAHC